MKEQKSYEAPNTVGISRHPGPHLGTVAIVCTVPFNAGLYPVTLVADKIYFAGPWEAGDVMVSYLPSFAGPDLCVPAVWIDSTPWYLHGISGEPLHFLGVRAAGHRWARRRLICRTSGRRLGK